MKHGCCHLWTVRSGGGPVNVCASGQAVVARFWLLLNDDAAAYPRSLEEWDGGPDTPFVYLDGVSLAVRLPPPALGAAHAIVVARRQAESANTGGGLTLS